MATSIHAGIVDYAPTLYGASGRPQDTAIVRDGLVNNLNHAADVYAQHRVNWYGVSTAVSNSHANYEHDGDPVVTGGFKRMGGAPFGAWPITLRADSQSYKLRIRLAAAINVGPPTCSIAVVLAPSGLGATYVTAAVDHTYLATFNNTTPGYVVGATQGTGAFTNYMEISTDLIETWAQTTQVYNDVASGEPTSIQQVSIEATVWGSETSSGQEVRMHGLHLSEFIGL